MLLQVRGNQVSVLGQVQKPGRFPLETTNIRVSDMLAAAGGVTPTGDDVADRHAAPATASPSARASTFPACSWTAPARTTSCMAAGDTIFVNKAPMFYIYGEAQRPAPTASSAA